MAHVTMIFVDHGGNDVTGTWETTGYRFRDYFTEDLEEMEADHRRAPGALRSMLAATYRGPDQDGIGVQWDVVSD